MSISTEINTSENLIVHVGTGKLEIVEVLEAIAAQFEHPSFVDGMSVLWDFTAAENVDISMPDLQKISDAGRTQRQSNRISRLALLVRTEFGSKLATVFEKMESQRGNLNRPIRSFWDRTEAVEWLRSSRSRTVRPTSPGE